MLFPYGAKKAPPSNQQGRDLISFLEKSRIISSFKQIVNRDSEIVGEGNQGFIARLTFACFVSADAVLADV